MQRLFVGIGSHQGDDQVGWLIVEQLKRRGNIAADFRIISKPLDLLDILDNCEELILVDAADGCENDMVYFWKWPTTDISSPVSRGTHGFGLVEALILADELRLLPTNVIIVGIPVNQFAALQPIQSKTVASIEKFVSTLEATYA